MADKILKSITFPNLPDKYIIPETTVDPTPTQGSTNAVQSGEVYSLKEDYNERLFTLDGDLYNPWEIGQRYVSGGGELWTNASTRITNKRGTYFSFKSGDIVALKNVADYQFLVGLSTDNGATWTGGSNRAEPLTIGSDAIGFITIRKLSGSFTELELAEVIENDLVILRTGTNIVHDNVINLEAIKSSVFAFGLFDVSCIDSGVSAQWCSAGMTSVVSAEKFGEYVEATKGNELIINASVSVAKSAHFNFIGIRIYEVDNSNTTLKTTDCGDLSNPIMYTVTNGNTTKIAVLGLLKADASSISIGYREIFVYKISICKKIIETFADVCTESGDMWEV